MGSLKSFIKSVRAAKTLSDERNIIQKESAKIRTSFRDDKVSRSKRRDNVAKLLYLFTLGERTHFGQVECLKLLASQHFTDKRLGYLGTMLLLDENQEVLMLVTNSLDIDLGHPNQYVVSLALTALANIASVSMAQDLFQRVEKLMTSTNPYLKKKAALCALRVIRRVPEYEELFTEHAKVLLNDTNHGVLLCASSLVIDMLDNNPELISDFAGVLPQVLNKIKTLSSTGYAPEFDVGRVPDPFLQTRLLRLLRALGQDNPELSEQMSDVLTAIAMNTDNSKNVGNAILYEVVLTIFGITAQTDLRVLGINILAKFLVGDNNMKYTALGTLLRVADLEPAAVQRHRQNVVACFRDPDISIRRRALELAYNLIDAKNVKVMVHELLVVLETADAEFRPGLVSQIALNAERFAPSKRWHIDTLIRTFVLAGNYTKENVLSAFILLVIDSPDLQVYATQRLYAGLKQDFSQLSLTLAALWLIGEYGDVLLKAGPFTHEDSTKQVDVDDASVLDLILAVLASPYATQVVQEYSINALIKLSTRVREPSSIENIRRAIQKREIALNIEVQQRGVEYDMLLSQSNTLKRGVLAKMPRPQFGEDLEAQHAKEMSKALVRRRRRPIISAPGTATNSVSTPVSDLLDFGSADTAEPASSALLNDIFGSAPSSNTPSMQTSDTKNILGLFNANETSSATAPTVSSEESTANQIKAWGDDVLAVQFSGINIRPGEAKLRAIFTASSPVSNLGMLVAVPKSQQLTLQAISKTRLAPGEDSLQLLTVTGPEGGSIRLRLRISYTDANGEQHQEQVDFSKLPSGLL